MIVWRILLLLVGRGHVRAVAAPELGRADRPHAAVSPPGDNPL